jgi:hypothetical protein
VRGNGYVVDSLEAALWSFFTTDDFRSGALAAANLGDDADTTAAIYGQLAGASYGVESIPEEWRSKLARLELLESYAASLHTKAQSEEYFSPPPIPLTSEALECGADISDRTSHTTRGAAFRTGHAAPFLIPRAATADA